MSLTSYRHGVRTIGAISKAIIGLVANGLDADAVTFRFYKHVLLANVMPAIGNARAKGTLTGVQRLDSDAQRKLIQLSSTAAPAAEPPFTTDQHRCRGP